MKSLIILTVLVVYVMADGFDDFKKKNGKSYSSKDAESAAAARYKSTEAAVAKHNANQKNSYKTEANGAADQTAEENAKRAGYKHDPKVKATAPKPKVKGTPPASLNFTSSMQPVRDQGDCGSCWAVSTASVYEYYNLKKNAKNHLLSEQNLLDCTAEYMDCTGGHPLYAMNYAHGSGISNGTTYNYVGVKQTCERPQYPPIYTTATGGCGDMLNGNEDIMKQIIATYGPVVAAISSATCTSVGSGTSLTFYSSGIFDDYSCSHDALDHAVVIVGYGTDLETGSDFWIIRNSWGTQWGENGYMRMLRGGNIAGIANGYYVPCEAT